MTGPAGGRPVEVYARVSARLLAFAADAVLLTALLFTASLVSAATLGPVVRFLPATGTERYVLVDQERLIVAAIVSAVLSAAYFIVSWTALPMTPGQRLIGVRVGRAADLRRLTLGQAASRWLLLMGPLSLGALVATLLPGLRAPVDLATLAWWLILLLTTVRSPTKQGLHDRRAGSVVIPGARLPGPTAAS